MRRREGTRGKDREGGDKRNMTDWGKRMKNEEESKTQELTLPIQTQTQRARTQKGM